ncbi:type II CRISPR RNA-guided endonuclease Cas9 [Massilia sp. W12]|uniref:type II CRISPR RNA-guided endonuclease Cas9 n=1 Tax=Massilia sp. W12 TaxID=3126507 RepID=UPI0030CC4DCB
MSAELVFGLDIGMASVGAAVLQGERILGLHVRAFDKAEVPKTGESLNKSRREKRLARRRLRRRAHRLLRLRRLFKRCGLLAGQDLPVHPLSPWELRVKGLDQRLSGEELALALYHLIKHRGFYSNRKSEVNNDEQAGQMLSGVQRNQQLKETHNFRSMAELALKHEEFQQAKRNKGGDYRHTFSRLELQKELREIFRVQRELGNPLISTELQLQCEKLLMERRPTLSGANLLKMVGYCTFEPTEHRAPKRGIHAERFVWLTRLNNLRIVSNGRRRELDESERTLLLNLPFEQDKLTYKQVRKKLDLPERDTFVGLSYRTEGKNPEDAKLFEASGFHTLRKMYEKAGAKDAWLQDRLQDDRLEALAWTLSCFKDDDEIRKALAQAGFADAIIESALEHSFSDFIGLSVKALKRILPFMQAGRRYDEAVQDAGYTHHSALPLSQGKRPRLSPPRREDFANPVVYRAINQARKMVNALIDQYGSPARVHIELARDLAKPFDERQKISKEQEKFQVEKEKAVKLFEDQYQRQAKGQDVLKTRLYGEQLAQCPYCQQSLDIGRLFEAGYAEIEHILPYSRSFDDSQNNKVLAHTHCNRNKGNRTPWEWLGREGEDSQSWRHFQAWVEAGKLRQAKKQRLLRKDFGAEQAQEFKERNLNDTRYICRSFKNMVEQQLQLAPVAADGKTYQRCVVVSGQLTGFLRMKWGLLKAREGGDLHHALDAAVIAACTPQLVNRISYWARQGELYALNDSYTDPETGEIIQAARQREDFPPPWPHFRAELLARLSPNPEHGLARIPGYPAQGVAPVRVSRAPMRRGSGEAHADTIRAVQGIATGQSAVNTPLQKLKLKDLDNIAGAHDPRNARLIEALRERLELHKDDGQKAFAAPFYRPSASDKTAPLVRSVRLLTTQKSGIPVRGGIADNGVMLRVDVFVKGGKYFAVPLYVADLVRAALPNKAALANKAESEWPEMDASYTFCFSVHPNDWLRIDLGAKGVKEGYFGGMDRATASFSLWTHDRNQAVGTAGLQRGIGIKTAANIEKCHVDMLGRLFKARPETRQALRRSGA